MSLERYIGLRKLELLRREVKSSTVIPLKTMPCWLINEDCLKEQQDKGNKQRLAIVILVSNKIEAKRLIANGLQFGGAIKNKKKYWDAGPESVCMKCGGIGHKRQGSYADRPKKCIMCAGTVHTWLANTIVELIDAGKKRKVICLRCSLMRQLSRQLSGQFCSMPV